MVVYHFIAKKIVALEICFFVDGTPLTTTYLLPTATVHNTPGKQVNHNDEAAIISLLHQLDGPAVQRSTFFIGRRGSSCQFVCSDSDHCSAARSFHTFFIGRRGRVHATSCARILCVGKHARSLTARSTFSIGRRLRACRQLIQV